MVAAAFGSAACVRVDTVPSPVAESVAPAPPAVPFTLTVLVNDRRSERPIRGALVRSRNVAEYTDVEGHCLLNVDSRTETTVDVSAPGYEPMTASAMIGSDERWTFFLASKPLPSP
jgi:hypothetical protein